MWGKVSGQGHRSLYTWGCKGPPSQSHSMSECFWGTKDQRLGKGEPLSPLQSNLLFWWGGH